MTAELEDLDGAMPEAAGSRVERFRFTKDSVGSWHDAEGRHRNWPVVYTINNRREVYIGESLNALGRMRQHLESPEKAGLEAVRIIIDDTYNKSVCLDLESFLIRMFSGDGRYEVLNRNDGVTNAGRADAVDSPFGLEPVDGAIDHASAGVSAEDWEALFEIDPQAVGVEADDTDVFLARMGAKVPDAVVRQHNEFRSQL